MIKKLLTAELVILLTLSTLTGCRNEETQETEATYQNEQVAEINILHPDIYLPKDTLWTRSMYSGEIEQYELGSTKEQAVFADEAKTFMAENGWELSEEKTDNGLVLRFVKNEWLVTYSLQTGGSLTLFVEPKSLYE